MSCRKSCNLEPHAAVSDIEVATSDEIHHVIKELQDSSNVELRSKALHKFIAIGERFYRKACKLHEEIDYFENYMERDFFDVEPLDDEQLENWHNYLDFIEKQEDFDWAVKLYERCLIPCANYPEFWMRYVEFMESKGGREIASFALERATQVFLKDVSKVHIFNARFREKIGDIEGARAAFLLCDTESDSSFVETAIKEANMEKRLGNLDTALDIYDKALKVAAEKEKLQIIPVLYIHFFRLKYLITGSADAAIDLLIAGIQSVPLSRLLLEELINFAMMHDGSRHLNVVDPIMANALACKPDGSQGLSSKDREDLSHLYLKLVDYCGTTHDIRKAWNRHVKSFPHLTRSTSSLKHPTNRLSNEPAEVPRLVAKQTSAVRGVNHTVWISSNENRKLLTYQNPANQSREKGDDDFVKENTPESSFQQSEDDAAREFKRLKQNFKNDASGMIIALPASCKSVENASRSLSSTNELQLSPKYDQIRTEPEEEHKHEHEREVDPCLKPISLENLSLDTQGKEPNDLTHGSTTAHENLSTAGQNPISAAEFAKKQNDTDEHESDRSSYSSGHRNLQKQTDPPRVSSENVETLCETKSPKSDGQSHQHQDQQHQDSPLVHKPTAHRGSITHVPTQNRPNPTGEITESNAWPVPNVQQPPVVQYPMQNSEQPGLVQNTQAYNQMWQYQYQQQQYQQQLMQMQQSFLMQQHQPFVQQQQQYVQQQQQQYQLYQQQEQYQVLYQQYQQQQEQGYQQLMQQHQLQEYMQMQQYQQQMQQQQQQPQDVHQNNQQQITAMTNQIWNGSHDQQGQGTTPSVYETPYTQQTSAHVAAQPMITNAPTNVESSHSPSFKQTPKT